jgi:alkylhydroperoxidase family enzyme
LEELKSRYGDKVEFLAIYVREAHPTDGWRMSSNDSAGIAVKQPLLLNERESVAKTCCSALKMSMPLLVDEMDDRVGRAYSGMPDRLYLIDRQGRIAYKSGRGPFGFKPGELEQSLVLSLLDQESASGKNRAATARKREKPNSNRSLTVAALTDTEAWKKMMPYLEKQSSEPLPVWIRALAVSLPQTAAAMLDLDYAQRALSTLPPPLRAKLRWIAADANRCDYAKAYARFDYVQAGGKAEDIDALPKQLDKLPEAERLALQLVRQLVEAAYSVRDEQVARLVELYGEKQVVAIVLVAAYANFQDRLLLALGAAVEEDGPLPPPKVHLRSPDPRHNAEAKKDKPKRIVAPPAVNPPTIPEKLDDPEWTALSFEVLSERLSKQIARRKARIHIPTWEQVRDHFPPDFAKPDEPVRIQWSLLAYGYQPRLSAAWSRGLRAFRSESDLDPVFHESMFWVVTRSVQCFY